MRRSRVGWLAALIAASLLVACRSETRRRDGALSEDQNAAINRLVRTEMSRHRLPGVAVAIMRNGKVLLRLTVGVADRASGRPVTAATPFQLASTTKSIVSTAALLLVHDGRLSLDAPIGDLLADLPAAWRGVTVRQLLSHTSGLPDIVQTPGQLDLIAPSWQKALPMIEHAPLQFAPGARWAYTQTNYVLVAQIIERVSGQPLDAFLRNRLFEPLGMHETFYPGEGAPPCATNYEPARAGGIEPRDLSFPAWVHAAGGLCSSLDDLIRWNAALDAGRVIPPDVTRKLWTAVRLNGGATARLGAGNIGYGLGWVVDETPGAAWVGHSGGNSTAYHRFRDDGLVVIALHNGVFDPDGFVTSIAALVRDGAGDTRKEAQNQLWDAARDGDASAAKHALDGGADIEALDVRSSRNGRRALNWAAFNDHVDVLRLLLSRGARVDAANATGFTALHHAAEAGAADAAAILIAAGANRDLKTNDGERPIDIARRKSHADVVRLLERSTGSGSGSGK